MKVTATMRLKVSEGNDPFGKKRSNKVVWGRVWTEKEGGDEIAGIGSVCTWRGDEPKSALHEGGRAL